MWHVGIDPYQVSMLAPSSLSHDQPLSSMNSSGESRRMISRHIDPEQQIKASPHWPCLIGVRRQAVGRESPEPRASRRPLLAYRAHLTSVQR